MHWRERDTREVRHADIPVGRGYIRVFFRVAQGEFTIELEPCTIIQAEMTPDLPCKVR